MTMYYKVATRAYYENLANDRGDENTFLLDFDDWRGDGPASLERIWRWLGWEVEPGASQIALQKHEGHKNPPEAFEVVPAG